KPTIDGSPQHAQAPFLEPRAENRPPRKPPERRPDPTPDPAIARTGRSRRKPAVGRPEVAATKRTLADSLTLTIRGANIFCEKVRVSLPRCENYASNSP